MKQSILVFLGVLFVINVFFRVRIMKLMKEIKKHQIRLEISDLLNQNKFNHLIQTTYPQHADLIKKYRSSMALGLILVVVVVASLVGFILLHE